MEDVALATKQLVGVHVLPAGIVLGSVGGTVLGVVVTEHIAGTVAHVDVGDGHIIKRSEEVPLVGIHRELCRGGIGGHVFTCIQQTTGVVLVDEHVELAHGERSIAAHGELASIVEVHVGLALHTAVVSKHQRRGELPVVHVVTLNDGAELIPISVELVVHNREGGDDEGNVTLGTGINKGIATNGWRRSRTHYNSLYSWTITKVLVITIAIWIRIIITINVSTADIIVSITWVPTFKESRKLNIFKLIAILECTHVKIFHLDRQHNCLHTTIIESLIANPVNCARNVNFLNTRCVVKTTKTYFCEVLRKVYLLKGATVIANMVFNLSYSV